MTRAKTSTAIPNSDTAVGHKELPFIHRDLSWLQFNGRVLSEARQTENPLLERVKFLAISSSNLDEFFMIRFASLNRAISRAMKKGLLEKAAALQKVQAAIFSEVHRLIEDQDKTLSDLRSELAKHRIRIVLNSEIEPQNSDSGSKPEEQRDRGRAIFHTHILPFLKLEEKFVPRKLHLLGNLQIAAIFADQTWMTIPKLIPNVFITHEKEQTWIFLLDDLLKSHLGPAFERQGSPALLRLTRDGDFTVDLEEEDTESIPDILRSRIRTRDKNRAIRLQYLVNPDSELPKGTASALKLPPLQIFQVPHTLCLHGLWSVVNSCVSPDSPLSLCYPPIEARIPLVLRGNRPVFDILKEKDLLLHHPYDSFDAFVVWIQKSCSDPAVTAIDVTVYRTDAVSLMIESLKAAAKTKKIRVIIELRARFDELNNLRLADDLRSHGVEVAFGFGKLKVHAKIALVTRIENDRPVLYTHLSTGNYNASTARQYTDLAILTSNPEIGEDARAFIDAVWEGEIPTQFKKLVSAPTRMHRLITQHIETEIKAAQDGKPARIVAKVNALVDEKIIESLYRASTAGVKVDLIVRGACALVPGVPGVSENIRVISIVDRFLEHSRLYLFESTKSLFLSSADWMPRNFFSRLEIAFPILDPRIYAFITDILIPTYLSDNLKARELGPNGEWKRRRRDPKNPPLRSQFYFEELARNDYKDTALERL